MSISTTKAAAVVSGRAHAMYWRRSWTQAVLPFALLHHLTTTGKVNTWTTLATTRFLRPPGGRQAALDNWDLDFVAHPVEDKNHSKLKLTTTFF